MQAPSKSTKTRSVMLGGGAMSKAEAKALAKVGFVSDAKSFSRTSRQPEAPASGAGGASGASGASGAGGARGGDDNYLVAEGAEESLKIFHALHPDLKISPRIVKSYFHENHETTCTEVSVMYDDEARRDTASVAAPQDGKDTSLRGPFWPDKAGDSVRTVPSEKSSIVGTRLPREVTHDKYKIYVYIGTIAGVIFRYESSLVT